MSDNIRGTKSPTAIWLRRVLAAAVILLLTTTVFAGAVAATDYGTVFVYELNSNIQGTWTHGASSITSINDPTTGMYYFAGEKIAEGLYKKGDDAVIVKYPVATITGIAGDGNFRYNVVGKVLYKGDDVVLTVIPPSPNLKVDGIRVTYPNKLVNLNFGDEYNSVTNSVTLSTENLELGTYKIQVIYNKSGFVDSVPTDLLVAKDVYTVLVESPDAVTVSSESDSVTQGNIVELIISGKPGALYTVDVGSWFFIESYGTTEHTGNTITIPNTGKCSIYLKANSIGDANVQIKDGSVTKASLPLSIIKGSITASLGADSYYIGNDILLSGTTNVGGVDKLYIYIKGTNMAFTKIGEVAVNSDNTWSKIIRTSEINSGRIDAGTYTIYVSTIDGNENDVKGDVYTVTSIALKQPFIAITEAPAVVVKGNTYTVKGIAEATDKIAVYVFGTNFFAFGNTSSLTYSMGNVFNGKSSITSDGSEFTVEFDVPSYRMDAGQYFLVIQHPMYDNKFSIYAEGTEIMLDPYHGSYSQPFVLFDTTSRQTTNAAQALCDALETQNIDDMYVKTSFVVAAPTSIINPLPLEITKGSKLTVSGFTNVGKDKFVTAEMLSTRFAALPKELADPSSFVTLTTKTDENGYWEVTFDTSGLNVDEYTVSVAVDSLDSTTAKIYVIEGVPFVPTEPQPTEPQPTVVPTEPQPTPTEPTYPTDPVIYPTEYPEYPASIGLGYSDLTITPNTPLVPNQAVSAVFKINLPKGSISDTDTLQFSSPLTNAKWEIKVFKGRADINSQNPAATITGTSTPDIPFKPLLFSIYYGDKTDVTLIVSFSGKVPETLNGQAISVFTAECSNSKIGSLSTASQYVYDTSKIVTEVNRINKAIETVEKRAAISAEMGVDVSSVTRELADAKAKSNAAKAAGSGNALTAYAQIDAGYTSLKKAERNLALVQLKSASANLGNVTDTYNKLYAMNWNTEAVMLETKVTSLKYTYDTLAASYNGGNIPDVAKLYKLIVDSFELRKTADGYLSGNDGTAAPANINLRVGWNFISVPKYLDSSCDTADELFADLKTKTSPLGYDPTETKTNGWYTLTTGMKIEPLNGYWIYTEEPQRINLKYSDDALRTPPTKTVHKGWNAIGICADKAMTAKSSFANLDWVRYLPWDVSSGRWSDPIIKGGSAENSEEIKIALGSGGWLYVENEGTYLGSTR